MNIFRELEQLPHVGTSLPKTWRDVRLALEADSRNYMGTADLCCIWSDTAYEPMRDELLQLKEISQEHLEGIREEPDLYGDIRNTIARLTSVLADMNALTPEMHRGTDFEQHYRQLAAALQVQKGDASMTAELAGLRDMLRSQRAFPDEMPGFDPRAAPTDPVTLFLGWLEAAIQAGVPAPHTMTLATADERGQPSSRVLICKDVDGEGRWHFASSAASGKGRDLAVNPAAALSFWWPQQGRQIRVRGAAAPAGARASAADFLARPPASRAEGLVGHQSEPLGDQAEHDRAFRAAHALVLADPELVAPAWTLYTLTAEQVEFWQGDPERRHVRLQYTRTGSAWSRQLLWP